jgi:hypothetical protein
MSDRLVLIILLVATIPGAVLLLIGVLAMFMSARGPSDTPVEQSDEKQNAAIEDRGVVQD